MHFILFNDAALKFQPMVRTDEVTGRARYPTALLEDHLAQRYELAENQELQGVIKIELADAVGPNGKLYVRSVVSGTRKGRAVKQTCFYVEGENGLIVRDENSDGDLRERFYDIDATLGNLVMPPHALSCIKHKRYGPHSALSSFLRMGVSDCYDVTVHAPEGFISAKGSCYYDEDTRRHDVGPWIHYDAHGRIQPHALKYYTRNGGPEDDEYVAYHLRAHFMEQRKALFAEHPGQDEASLEECALNLAIKTVFATAFESAAMTRRNGESYIRMLQRMVLSGNDYDLCDVYNTLRAPRENLCLADPTATTPSVTAAVMTNRFNPE